MGNRKARDFQLRQEQQASWDRLRLTPWSPDSVGRAWKSGRPRVQIIRFPSFSQCSFFEVCELAGEWLLYQSEIVEPWPVASVRGYDLVPFDSQTLAAFVADLTSIAIPAAPPVTGRAGLDGVTTQLAIFGDLWAQARYQWWSDPPPAWMPLVKCTSRMLDAFILALEPR